MTPLPTRVALVITLALTAAALAAFHAGVGDPRAHLALYTLLFAVRVAGQLVVRARKPAWLPPTEEWNLVPYPILLPLQLGLLALMCVVAVDPPPTGDALVGAALLYWLTMAARYTVRMTRNPAERWFGGAIPIVFHCVLAAVLFILGASNAA